MFAFHDESVAGLLSNATSELEYLDQVSEILSNRQSRLSLGEEVRGRVLAAHVGAAWLSQLNAMYDTMSRREHGPAPIAVQPGGTTPYDIALATFLEAQAWRPMPLCSHRVRSGILSDLATSLIAESNRGDGLTFLRRVWSNSRRPQDLAVAAVVTVAALARTGRNACAAALANALGEA